MKWTRCLCAVAVMLIATPGLPVADALEPAPLPQALESGTQDISLSSHEWFDPSRYDFIECGAAEPRRDVVARFGWWGVDVDGSPSNVGEWQGLGSSSPFWDVDGLISDGFQTIDFFANGPEEETTQAGLYFYDPRVSADVDYDRFIHRFGYKPHAGFNVTDIGGAAPPNFPADANGAYWAEDSNVGRDYAIRVQELKADFKGRLTQNVKWRLNLWGMRKEGTRQADALMHCYGTGASGGTRCHLVSQSQRIDWRTMEIEPVLEARFGCLSVEYSHKLRTFEQSDQIVQRDYSSFAGAAAPLDPAGGLAQYALVPENVTEIDRIKAHADLGWCTDMYVLGWVGNTHNKFRDTDRQFHGVDARVTNRSLDGLTVTGYGKTSMQNNERAEYPLNFRYDDFLMRESAATLAAAGDPHPVDRTTTAAGVKSRWRPFYGSCGWRRNLALTSGYEWREINRRHVEYEVAGTPFTQPHTITNQFHVGASQKWCTTLNGFVRFIWRNNNYPLVGLNEGVAFDVDAGINSNLPEREELVEIGGTWTPTDNFILNASFWIENTYNHTEYVRFDEDNYPLVVSAWYAPDCRWSFSGGYANFTNWIVQDITLGGAAAVSGGGPHAGEFEASPSYTAPWRYTGQADVVDLGVSYAYSCRVRFSGGFQYTRGRNVFAAPPGTTITINDGGDTLDVTYGDLPGYSLVEVNTYRFMAGVDYEWTRNIDCYFRYNYYDFDNQGTGYSAGTAHMFLGGVAATF